MNPAALLALISELYERLAQASDRIQELEAKLKDQEGKDAVQR